MINKSMPGPSRCNKIVKLKTKRDKANLFYMFLGVSVPKISIVGTVLYRLNHERWSTRWCAPD